MSKLYRIKNMACSRCISAVETIFMELDTRPISVILGQVETESAVADVVELERKLLAQGFELLQTASERTVESIVHALQALLDDTDLLNSNGKVSAYIEETVGLSYSSLSKLFSQSKNITIEKYFVQLRVERAKLLLQDKSKSVKDVGYLLGYSSVQYLQKRFQEEFGMTIGQYRGEIV
jgi:AraC-like DNA-binding protein